jgi:hypothetical protein
VGWELATPQKAEYTYASDICSKTLFAKQEESIYKVEVQLFILDGYFVLLAVIPEPDSRQQTSNPTQSLKVSARPIMSALSLVVSIKGFAAPL